METVQQLRLAFLEDAISYFNSTNRCIYTGRCTYHPSNSNKVGISEGCIIGRKLPSELALSLDTLGNSNSGVFNDDVFQQLPAELIILGQKFLMEMQRLHDYYANWDEKGLSNTGKIRVSDIKKHFILNDNG